MITAGLDMSATTTKAVVLKDGDLVGYGVAGSGGIGGGAAEDSLRQALIQAGLSLGDVDAAVVTGAFRREACFTGRVVAGGADSSAAILAFLEMLEA